MAGESNEEILGSSADDEEYQLQPTGSFVQDMRQKFQAIVADPQSFFASFELDEPRSQPLTIYGLTLAANLICTLLISLVHPASLMTSLQVFAVTQVVWFLIACGTMRFASGIFGGTGTLEQIVRGFAYANAPNVLASIPFLNVFAWLYSLYLVKLAVERIEGLSPQRLNIVVGITAGATLATGIVWMLLSTFLFIAKHPGGT